MRKRILALFMALVMCLSLLPTAAFAEGITDGDAVGGDGTTITGTTTTGDSTGAPTGGDAIGAPADSDATGGDSTGTPADGDSTDGDSTTTDTTDTTDDTSTDGDSTGGDSTTTDTTDTPGDSDTTGEGENDSDIPVVQSAPPLLGAALPAVDGMHTHCLCGGTHKKVGDHRSDASLTWMAADTLPDSAGYYYLTADVKITSTWKPANRTYLCLNGHTITADGDFTAITVAGGVTFTLTDCTDTPGIITHAEGKSGSGVNVEDTGTFHMYGGKISGNSAVYGGGVYVYGSTNSSFTLYGGEISGNDASVHGGGVYAGGRSSLLVYGGSITDNSAVNNGGGVYTTGSFEMYGGKIAANRADNDGGGLYTENKVADDAALTAMHGGEISDNCTVYGEGGGVYVGYGNSFAMYDGTFTGNSAAHNNGGAVYVRRDGGFTLYGGKITGNSATDGGGAYVDGSFVVCGGEISGNTVIRHGGGVYNSGSFEMHGGKITANTADKNGGGVCNAGSITLSGGEIVGNKATLGGGVHNSGGKSFIMTGGSIGGNTATQGGGVYGAGACHTLENGKPDYSASTTTFGVGGGANVTGNTIGGTWDKTAGKYTGGAANNMYVPDWTRSIYIADDFSGSFGVTVNETDWCKSISSDVNTPQNTHGANWLVVQYMGGKTGTVSYDDAARFSFTWQILTCQHPRAAETIKKYPNAASGGEQPFTGCPMCKKTIIAQVTFGTGAKAEKRGYETIYDAYYDVNEDAYNYKNDRPCTIKLFADGALIDSDIVKDSYDLSFPGKHVTLDLNGHTLRGHENQLTFKLNLASGKLTIVNGTIFSSMTVKNGAELALQNVKMINSMEVEAGGKLTTDGLSGGKTEIPTLTVYSGKDDVTITGSGSGYPKITTLNVAMESGVTITGSNKGYPEITTLTVRHDSDVAISAQGGGQPKIGTMTVDKNSHVTITGTGGGHPEIGTLEVENDCDVTITGTDSGYPKITTLNVESGCDVTITAADSGHPEIGTLTLEEGTAKSRSKLTINGVEGSQPKITTLDIGKACDVALKGGSYRKITVAEGQLLDIMGKDDLGRNYSLMSSNMSKDAYSLECQSLDAGTGPDIQALAEHYCTGNYETLDGFVTKCKLCGRVCTHDKVYKEQSDRIYCKDCNHMMKAQIGSDDSARYYRSLEDAFTVAAFGQTVRMLDGIEGLTLKSGFVTLDMNGCKLSGTVSLGNDGYMMLLNFKDGDLSEADIVLNENGNASLRQSAEETAMSIRSVEIRGRASLFLIRPNDTIGMLKNNSGSAYTLNHLSLDGYVLKYSMIEGGTADKTVKGTGSMPAGATWYNVTIEKCSHPTTNNTGVCTACGMQLAVEMKASSDGSPTYFSTLSEAASFINELSSTDASIPSVSIKLLDNVAESGAGAIALENGNVTLDLNGKRLTADIKAFENAKSPDYRTLSVKDTSTAGGGKLDGTLTISGGTVAISGGTFKTITVTGTGKSVGQTLASGYGYRYTSEANRDEWVTGDALDGTTLSAIRVEKLPITGVTVSPGETISIASGSPAAMSATATAAAGKDVTYQWYTVDGSSETAIEGAANSSYTANDLAIGAYKFVCKATAGGYTASSQVITVKVTGTLAAKDGAPTDTQPAAYTTPVAGMLTYTGAPQPLVTAGAIEPAAAGTMKYRLDSSGTWSETVPIAINAGDYTVLWYIEGGTNHNGVGSESAPAGSVPVTIAPKKVSLTDSGDYNKGHYKFDGAEQDQSIECTYTGSPITPGFTLMDEKGTVIPAVEYTAAYSSNTGAGNALITITDLSGGNYKIDDSWIAFTITKEQKTENTTYTVHAKAGQTVTVNLDKVADKCGVDTNIFTRKILEKVDDEYIDLNVNPATYVHDISYTVPDDAEAGSKMSRYFRVESQNQYAELTVEIVVGGDGSFALSEHKKDYDGAAVTVDALAKPAGMNGTWAWKNSGTAPKAVKDSGSYQVVFTPTDGCHTVTLPVQVTISPRALTLNLSNYDASKDFDDRRTAPIAGIAFSGLVSGDSFTLGRDYVATAAFDDAAVGTGKNVSVTVTLLNGETAKNYCFKDGDSVYRTIRAATTAEIRSSGSLPVPDAEHAHCVCGAPNEKQCTKVGHTCDGTIKYVRWNDPNGMPEITAAENGTPLAYYLDTDVTTTGTWLIKSDVYLCLNGHTITCTADQYADGNGRSNAAIWVDGNATLYMSDCQNDTGKLTRRANNNGTGVYLSGGTLELYGGNITGNNGEAPTRFSCKGGGVYSCGTFHMYGGKITNNYASEGGGAYIEGEFLMYGGEISGNTAGYGGGVLSSGGNTVMTGGRITGNRATSYGGGLYISRGVNSSVGGTAIIVDNAGPRNTNNFYLHQTGILRVQADFTGEVSFSGTPGYPHNAAVWWTMVNYESDDPIPDTIYYDDPAFGVVRSGPKKGQLDCHHWVGVNGDQCSLCHATVAAAIRYEDGHSPLDKCFPNIVDAFNTAAEPDDACTVRPVGDQAVPANAKDAFQFPIFQNDVTLDLSGKALTVSGGSKFVLAADNKLTIDDKSEDKTGTIQALEVRDGATLHFKTGTLTGTLTAFEGSNVALSGGTFNEIKAQGGKTCSDLLAPGYAYFKNGKSVSGNVTALSGVTVGEHTSCTFNEANHGICACGRECPHGEINASTHKCSVCKTQMVAMVTKGAAGSTPLYYTTFNAALEGVRDAKSTENATLTLLENTNLSENATLPGGVYTIELNGKTLGNSAGKTYVLTADGSGAATIRDSSTGKTGRIGCTLRCIAAGSNSPNIMSGTFARLELDMAGKTGTGWPHLFGGTFEKIVRADSSTTSRTIRVISMLAPGCALKKTTSDTDFVAAATEITATAIEDVTVVTCTYTGGICPYCGTSYAAELTTYDASGSVIGYEYCDNLAGAVSKIKVPAAKATIRLLQTAPYGFTYNNATIPLTLDMNKKQVQDDITVTAGSLTITGDGQVGVAADITNKKVTVNGGTVKIEGGTFTGGLTVGANGRAVLSGGKFGSIKVEGTVNGTARKVSDLLAEGYGYWCTYEGNNYNWVTDGELSGNTLGRPVTVRQRPVTNVTAEPQTIDSGASTTLTATVTDCEGNAITESITYEWYEVIDALESKIDGEKGVTYTATGLAVGTHTFVCKAMVDGYPSESEPVTVTVNKATLTPGGGSGESGSSSGSGGESGGSTGGSESAPTYTAPKAKTPTYTGAAQALIDAGTVPDGCTMMYSLDKSSWTADAETLRKADAGTYTVYWYIDGGTSYNDVGSEETPAGSVKATIAPMPVVISAVNCADKTYDGTAQIEDATIGVTFTGVGSDAALLLNHVISDASFGGSGIGPQPYTATVTLYETNYAFSETDGHTGGTYVDGTTVALSGMAFINPCPLETMPTVKESVVKLTQDAAVRSGSYPLSGNVNVVLPEDSNLNLDLSRELRFALGTLPTKVKAQIGEGGMLSYTINGGKAGEKFSIPVTITLPNFTAAAEDTPTEDVPATQGVEDTEQPITLSFTVEIELTGGSQQVPDNDPFAPIHRPTGGGSGSNGGTSGGGSNGSSSGNGSASGSAGASGSGVASPGTGDAGIAVYAMLSLSAAIGMCAIVCVVFSRRRRRG